MIILESAIDPTRKDLDKDIFEKINGNYNLKSYVKKQLYKMIEDVDRIVKVDDWFVKGSILSYQWLPRSDVDIVAEVSSEMSEEEIENIKDEIDTKLGDVNVSGTEHRIEVFLQRGKYNRGNADGIYDVKTDKFLKGPYNITVNMSDYIKYFESKAMSFDVAVGELERNIIDYLVIQSLSSEEIEELSSQTKNKVEEINQSIDDIVNQYEDIKALRYEAFKKDMTPEEINKFGTKNKLPNNITQKLFERYQYLRLAKSLKELIKRKNITTASDVKKVKKVLDNKLSKV